MTIDQYSAAGGENHMDSVEEVGLAKMVLDTNPNPRYNIATYRYHDIKLADISALKYRVYDASVSSEVPYLNFNVSFDGNDTWQKRLVHLPGAAGNPSISPNTWTTVNAIDSGNAMWYWSGEMALHFGQSGITHLAILSILIQI